MDLADVMLHSVNIQVQLVDEAYILIIKLVMNTLVQCTRSLPKTNIQYQCPKNNARTKTNTGIYNNLVNKDT